jgi:hypothetical protein
VGHGTPRAASAGARRRPPRTGRPALAALALLGAAPLALPARAELYAERMQAGNALRRQLQGPDAYGGIGDWAFGNGTVCGVVSDSAHRSSLALQGGVLVDLGHCDRDGEQLILLQPMVNLSQGVSPPIDAMRAEVVGREARIVARGERGGVRFETTWALGEERPRALRVETLVTRVAEGERFFALGELALHPNASLRPFTALIGDLARSHGFDHPVGSEGRSMRERMRTIQQGDLHVLVGEDALEPGIAYGVRLVSARLERADGSAGDLPRFAMTGAEVSLFAVFARPFWIGGEDEIGMLQFLQTPFLDLEVGDRVRLELAILVGERADVASVTDQVYASAPRVAGRVDDPDARLHVLGEEGGALTQVRPEPDGSFAFRAPAGRYRLRALAPGGRERSLAFAVEGGDLELAPVQVGSPARVLLPRGQPMRLVFVGEDGTPDPALRDDLLELRFGGERPHSALVGNSVSLAGVASDPESLAVPPGRYRVYATRGPEYGLGEARLEVAPGASLRLAIEAPRRVLDSPGWIAADLHVHAAGSFDTALPMQERVRSFAAQGGEVLVGTEHDHVVDYAPVIRALGLGSELVSVVGAEATSITHGPAAPFGFGHANAFPLPFRPREHRGGTPQSQGVRLRDLVAEVRGHGGGGLVQVNHPRQVSPQDDREKEGVDDEAFLSHLSVPGEPFDPRQPLDSARNRSLIERDPGSGLRDFDFDAVELLNGATGAERNTYYKLVRADWLSWLLQGEFRTATANSDSHRNDKVVALPRTYVRVADDSIAGFEEASFVAALRRGEAYGTTGPLLDVRLGGTGLGGLHRGDRATLSLEVRAAPWVPVSTARVYVNGARAAELAIERGARQQVPLSFAVDSFVTVEVEGRPDVAYAAVVPKSMPFAFTNPIFVDADGDGAWKAPGLPPELPPSVATPLAE